MQTWPAGFQAVRSREISTSGRLQQSEDNFSDFPGQEWRDSISHLVILLRTIALEKVVVGERLQACCLPNRQAPALGGLGMNVVVPILGNMGHDCCRWLIAQLNTESINKRR